MPPLLPVPLAVRRESVGVSVPSLGALSFLSVEFIGWDGRRPRGEVDKGEPMGEEVRRDSVGVLCTWSVPLSLSFLAFAYDFLRWERGSPIVADASSKASAMV